jgi:hypothetical protein
VAKSALDKLNQQEKERKEKKKEQEKKAKEPKKRLKCLRCEITRTAGIHSYYETTNPLIHSSGYIPVCKSCISKIFISHYEKAGEDLDMAIFKTCADIDVIYDEKAVKNAKRDIENNRDKHREDSNIPIYGKERYFGVYKAAMHILRANQNSDELRFYQSDIFKKNRNNKMQELNNGLVEAELISRWGRGYDKEDYVEMQNRYDKLAENYGLDTSIHEENLTSYVKVKMKYDKAIVNDDAAEAAKWSKQVKDMATAAKLNVSQRSKSDDTGGLNAFGIVAQEVEKEKDIIQMLPKFKQQPHDIVDFLIWAYINAARDIKGMPKVEYHEIWQFYDDAVSEFVQKFGNLNGMFDNDMTKKGRKNIQEFLMIPEEFEED